MPLADIVRELGGELYGPTRAVIPGPGHGPDDRSISLLVDPSGRLVVTSWGRSTWQEVLDDLRARGFVDEQKRLCGRGIGVGYHAGGDRDLLTRAEKTRVAAAIWDQAGPVEGTLSSIHFRRRGVTRPLPAPDVVRHATAAPLRAYDSADTRSRPALIAAIRDPSGTLAAVEVTFLDRLGRRTSHLRLSRKVVGVIPIGSAVRLDVVGSEMLVGEGVFTTYAASERFGLPGWALLSTSRMRTWLPPAGVRSVLVAGDNGRAGRRAAATLVRRLRDEGVRAWPAFPNSGFGDFDEQAQAERPGPERVEAGPGRARGGGMVSST